MTPEQILNDMDFEQQMSNMADRQLLEFICRQVWLHGKRLRALEQHDYKLFGAIGMAGTFIGGIIIGLIEHFRKG